MSWRLPERRAKSPACDVSQPYLTQKRVFLPRR
jgi:hypothetical protein